MVSPSLLSSTSYSYSSGQHPPCFPCGRSKNREEGYQATQDRFPKVDIKRSCFPGLLIFDTSIAYDNVYISDEVVMQLGIHDFVSPCIKFQERVSDLVIRTRQVKKCTGRKYCLNYHPLTKKKCPFSRHITHEASVQTLNGTSRYPLVQVGS